MTGSVDEWQARIDKALAELRADFDFLCIRHSAVEWFVEQMVANLLMRSPAAEADRFLDEMSVDHGRSWMMGADGPQPVPADLQAQIHEQIVHLAEKIRKRVNFGRRLN